MIRDAALALPARLGASVIRISEQAGGITILAAQVLRRLLPPRLDRHELVRNLQRMGVESVPIVMATAAFTGAIMVIQAAPMVERFDAKQYIGWGASFVTFREVGPLLLALMFNGRVGANNTAELGTMVVTSQIDALRALAIDPISYLVLPRVLTMISMMFVLTLLGDGVALVGEVLTAWGLLDVHPYSFISSAVPLLTPWDVGVGLVKSALFGLMIAMTSCYFGLATKGGAPGVGRSVNASVVASASGIFIVDYLSTFVLQ
ncbi:MAG: ABC transporter permease [Myxococcales bacterium]|nr:ABC transporter permease [Myxococcales bacterium]